MSRDRVAFPFLFSFFHFSSLFLNKQNCPLKNVTFKIHSIVLLIGILLMSFSISFNKKELYENHVQNLYSNRKVSDKLY